MACNAGFVLVQSSEEISEASAPMGNIPFAFSEVDIIFKTLDSLDMCVCDREGTLKIVARLLWEHFHLLRGGCIYAVGVVHGI